MSGRGPAPRARARAAVATLEQEQPTQVLRFDFTGDPAPVSHAPKQREDSIKNAIVRWLNEQL